MKKLLSVLCTAAMLLSTAVLPASAETTEPTWPVAAFVDELDTPKADFKNPEATGYVEGRFDIAPNAMEFDKGFGGDFGNVYHRAGSHLTESAYITYCVNEGWVFSAKSYRNTVTGEDYQVTFSFSVDNASTESWDANEVTPHTYYTGEISKGDGSRWKTYQHFYQVPEGMKYAQVRLPKCATPEASSTALYTTWAFGIMNAAMYDVDFFDDLDTPDASWTDSTAEGYVPQRVYLASPQSGTYLMNKGTHANENGMIRLAGWWDRQPYIVYKAYPGAIVTAVYMDAFKFANHDGVRIWESTDGNHYTTTTWTEVTGNVRNLDSQNKRVKTVKLSDNAKLFKVSLPHSTEYSTEGILTEEEWTKFKSGHWNIALLSVEMNDAEYVDHLDCAYTRGSFVSRADANYNPFRVDSLYLEAEDWGANFGYSYRHSYGNEKQDGYIIYRCLPGMEWNVDTYGSSQNAAFTFATSPDNVNWTPAAATTEAKGTLTDKSGNVRAITRNTILMPAGHYYAKMIVPAWKSADGATTLYAHYGMGFTEVYATTPELPDYVWSDPNDTADFDTVVTVSGHVTRNISSAESLNIFFASYDSLGRLAGVDMKSKTPAKGEKVNYELSVSAAETYAVYLWNGTTPICEAIPVAE